MADFMKDPCTHCPFRRDIHPFLREKRAEELAYAATNQYNSFPCHKTTVPVDDDSGRMMVTNKSKECAGFLTMQIKHGRECPDGFNPSFELTFDEPWDMIDHYSEKK